MLPGHEMFDGPSDLGVRTSCHPTFCGDEATERFNLSESRETITFPTRRTLRCIAEVFFRRYS